MSQSPDAVEANGPSVERQQNTSINLNTSNTYTSGGFVTEIDIAKIVAQKYAKSAPAEERNNFSSLVKEEFRKVFKVWSAFVKFIRSQAQGKSKLVDTTFIGHLYKKDDELINNSNLELLISQDFFEAGKFKNKQLPTFIKNEEIIKQFKDQNKLIQVNPATIGFVCSLHKNLVQRILTDFWSAFIELSRRTQQEVVLDFKVGNLHLYKNGELLFESKSDTENNFASPTKRNEPREDISFIDSASAILSTNGGRVMSIKSSYMENLSVRTPKSHASKASSTYSTRSTSSSNPKMLQSQNWLKYRMRQKFESAQREKNFLSQSNDAPAPLEEELQKQKIPYPFLSAFIERRTGQRFSKRVKFDPSQTNQEQFLQQIISQINTNKEKQENLETAKKEQDQEFLDNLRKKVLLDQQQVHEDKIQKQMDFIQANEALKQQKLIKEQNEDEDKKNYKLTYFPFTHGDSVIHQRQAWKEMQQADLAVQAQQEAVSPIKRKPLNALKPDELHTIFSTKVKGQSRSPEDATPLRVTQDFLSISATPNGSFLRPNYPYKIKSNECMSKTMDGAWKRFEEQLKFEEEVKKKQAEMFSQAITRDQQMIESEILRRLIMREETRRELDKQVYFKKIVHDYETQQSKKPVKTSFGPEENQMLYEILEKRNMDAKQNTKNDLEELINEKDQRNKFMNGLERTLDQNMVEQTVQAFHEEQRERKALEIQRKQDLKNAWIEQAMINEKVRNIDNLFN